LIRRHPFHPTPAAPQRWLVGRQPCLQALMRGAMALQPQSR